MSVADASASSSNRAVVIGGGPAGLMAAEALAQAGCGVDVFDAMPTVGRKFLLAGIGGLNLTHGEPFERFVSHYGERATWLTPHLQHFGPQALRDWAGGLGISTFVGSSGRVFPSDMKAAPLLRAWLHRLKAAGVRFHMRQRWQGWDDAGCLRFEGPDGVHRVQAGATVLALGGASWPRLGSDGAWWPWLQARGVDVSPLRPSNCGFDVAWCDFFRERYAGQPLKSVAIRLGAWQQWGEFVVTAQGVEGSLIYAASATLRNRIEAEGQATLLLDLLPARKLEWVQRELAHPRGSRSLASHLKSRLNLSGVKAGLLWEVVPKEQQSDPVRLAALIKALPLVLNAARPIAEAISTAGGVKQQAVDARCMLKALPGVFVAGEMLDWEAPTGGYLLTACFSTGVVAGQGAAAWLQRRSG